MKSVRVAPGVRGFLQGLQPPSEPEKLSTWGWKTAEALSSLVDELIAGPVAKAAERGAAVYAVGGFGRRELSPFSDVDLLFVAPDGTDLSAPIARLWDAGLRPSIIIRAPRAIRDSAKGDLAFATTILDARHLAGERQPEIERAASWVLEERPHFVAEHVEEAGIRARKYRGAGCQEPELRNGPGGLRDAQTCRWIAAADPAAGARFPEFPPTDYGILMAARAIVHTVTGRREDRMLLSSYGALDDWLGWPRPEDYFRQVLRAMKRIRFAEKVSGSAIESLTTASLKLCLAHDRPRIVALRLREWDSSGELESFLPEWRMITGLVRNDVAHLYTPEEHTLRVIAGIADLLERPAARALNAQVIHRTDLLFLSALFHDIGKGRGGDHASEGERISGEALSRWGYSEAEIEIVRFLVREHLLLPHNAFRRDIDDPSLIHELAGKVGDIERLTMLYVLSLADLAAVSDELLTEWKSSLLDTLAIRLARQSQTFLPPEELSEHIIRTHRSGVRALADPRIPDNVIAEHFERLDARYALAFGVRNITEHLELIGLLSEQPIVARRTDYPHFGFSEITLITRSRTGLFGDLAGILSARGFNILSADIFTRADGVAIDAFKVEIGSRAGQLLEENWKRLEEDFVGIVTGSVDVERQLGEREPYDRRTQAARPCFPEENALPAVAVDNRSSSTHTVIEVMARDEMGLLYRIARAFRDCSIEITSAIVSTAGDTAVDVFYVTQSGDKILAAAVLDEFRGALRRRLCRDTAAGGRGLAESAK